MTRRNLEHACVTSTTWVHPKERDHVLFAEMNLMAPSTLLLAGYALLACAHGNPGDNPPKRPEELAAAPGASPSGSPGVIRSTRTSTLARRTGRASPEPRPPVNRIEMVIQTKRSGGKVRCGLYADAGTWLGRRYAFKHTARVDGRRAVCVFDGVPPGRYAASAYHDANDNSKFDRNFLGLPSEDFCFSSGARAGLGPPSFDDADFQFEGGVLRMNAQM